MISKQFKLMSSALAVLGVAAFIYFQYQMRPEVLGDIKTELSSILDTAMRVIINLNLQISVMMK